MENMLVVVDFQVDFVNGTLGFEKAPELDKGILRKISEYKENGGAIVVTLDTHTQDYLSTREGKNLPVAHCVDNTKGHELYGESGVELNKLLSENRAYFIKKYSFGVSPQEMIKLSEKYSPNKIELVGLVTNICVLANACTFQAAFPEADIVVYENLCASFDESLHKKTLEVLKGTQVKVM